MKRLGERFVEIVFRGNADTHVRIEVFASRLRHILDHVCVDGRIAVPSGKRADGAGFDRVGCDCRNYVCALPFLVTYGVSSALSRRFADFHVSQSQAKSTRFLRRALGSARFPSDQDLSLRNVASRLVVPAIRRTGHPFAV